MKKKGKLRNIIIPAVLVMTAGVIFMSVRILLPDKDPCEENVQRLQALEASDISQTEKELQALKKADKEASVSQIQEEISSDDAVLSDVQIRQAFQGTVILGDSITESIVEYGFLDTDVVVSKRGLSVDHADEQIETAIGLHPGTIFMAFGSNDLEEYGEDSAAFTAAYKKQIQKLQEALPDVPIYINGILPILQSAIDETPALGYYPQYNEALQALCEEMGCTFIDNSFITENNEDMYEPDGEHVVLDFYPKWLTYMAETAGL